MLNDTDKWQGMNQVEDQLLNVRSNYGTKVYCDAAWIEETNEAGFGFVVEDELKGLRLLGNGNCVSPSVVSAELNAVWMSLVKFRQMNIKHIKLFTDCKMVIDMINGDVKAPWFMKDQVRDVIKIGDEVQVVEWSHIRRENNQNAHWLAKHGLLGDNLQFKNTLGWTESDWPMVQGLKDRGFERSNDVLGVVRDVSDVFNCLDGSVRSRCGLEVNREYYCNEERVILMDDVSVFDHINKIHTSRGEHGST
ncbi:hypothetical protein Cni_G09023 [Canna indica]|uniref:RNase H type-1 domain-containing protein n=1 Tax=Canna indica TaxID=4628 RepID=A0AAQ3K1L2_9LILI|nr:hypothetical protein Cni_G09023 [Canna indica]